MDQKPINICGIRTLFAAILKNHVQTIFHDLENKIKKLIPVFLARPLGANKTKIEF